MAAATITVESELNVGATASILFPAARSRPRTGPLEAPITPTEETRELTIEERRPRIIAAR